MTNVCVYLLINNKIVILMLILCVWIRFIVYLVLKKMKNRNEMMKPLNRAKHKFCAQMESVTSYLIKNTVPLSYIWFHYITLKVI